MKLEYPLCLKGSMKTDFKQLQFVWMFFKEKSFRNNLFPEYIILAQQSCQGSLLKQCDWLISTWIIIIYTGLNADWKCRKNENNSDVFKTSTFSVVWTNNFSVVWIKATEVLKQLRVNQLGLAGAKISLTLILHAVYLNMCEQLHWSWGICSYV